MITREDLLKKFSENDFDNVLNAKGVSDQAKKIMKTKANNNTSRTYRSQINKFFDYGGTIPASVGEVVSYLAYIFDSEGRSESTVKVALSAIAGAHHLYNLPFDTQEPLIQTFITGMHGNSDNEIFRSRALETWELKKIIALLKEDAAREPFRIDLWIASQRDIAQLLLLYYGAFRIEELLNLRVSDITEISKGLKVVIRNSKKNKTKEEWKAIPFSHNEHCAATEVLKYMRTFNLNATEYSDGYLFFGNGRQGALTRQYLYHQAHGTKHDNTFQRLLRFRRAIRSLPKLNSKKTNEKTYRNRIKALARRSGLGDLDRLSSHSFRVGFVTECARRGVPYDQIMNQTGHKTTSMLMVYIRESDKFNNNPSAGLLD